MVFPVLFQLHKYVLLAVLVDSGKALKIVTALLERLLADQGAGAAKEAWTATGLSLQDFVPEARPLLLQRAFPNLTPMINACCGSALMSPGPAV